METAGGPRNDSPGSRQEPDDELQAQTEHPSCPKCGSADVRRSHSEGVLTALLRVLGRWPFRCRSCRSRFYRSAPPPADL